MPPKLLIVDDEADIVGLLRDYFELTGYSVLAAHNGPEALAQLEKQPDLIILDIQMPGMDGLELCARIRSFVACPIMFLTAKVEDSDKIAGLKNGGDDYVVKPFSVEELGARVEAHLRREQRQHHKTRTKFAGELVIDYTQRAVFYRQQLIELAKKEFEIVELLSLNSSQIFDKEHIYEKIWGWDREGDSAVIAEHVRRIRMKFAAAGSKPPIETVWGVGYTWAN